jgi:sigma-B regulation protein RsbU (phosphoserine phosphatase)
MPQDVPQIEGWEFAARWQPAREVAGDYFDFIPVGEDTLGLAIADVTDKGAPAALFMIFSNSVLRGSVHPSMAPAESVHSANRQICAKSTNGMFVSLVYAQLNTHTGEVVWVNAGHNPPLYYNQREDRFHHLLRTGMVLGIDPDVPYEERARHLESGDFLLLYTDGIIDAIDADSRSFGMAGLESVVRQHRAGSAEEIVRRLDEAVSEHSGETTPFDDITILLVKRT